MNTTLAERPTVDVVADLVLKGDVSKLTQEQRLQHYLNVCDVSGLDPRTKPFDYIKFEGGREQLYPNKGCAEQLRMKHGISLHKVSEIVHEGVLTVTVRATGKDGRSDEDIGAVNIAGMKGAFLANAAMKAMTKAKRRVTLSYCGLGGLIREDREDDEDSTDDVKVYTPRIDPSATHDDRSSAVEQKAKEDERVPDIGSSAAERASTMPHRIERRDDSDTSWSWWMGSLMAFVRAAPDADTINEWTNIHAEDLATLQKRSVATHRKLTGEINAEIAKHQ